MENKQLDFAPSQLLSFLNSPKEAVAYNDQQWSSLIRTAKTSKLLAHVAWLAEHYQLENEVPEKVKNQFASAKKIVEFRHRQALWEVNRLQRALSALSSDVIVLKGGAYLLAAIPFARYRLLADIDIMVEKSELEIVENHLLSLDWQATTVDEYDQQYYRRWMHEIPPLRHVVRGIEVDLHHTIIPPTSRLKPNPALFFTDAVRFGNDSRFKLLSSSDMVLHSAVHLFFDSDLSNKLRDLVDLDQLLRHFYSQQPSFFVDLLTRASQLGLNRPLYYTLRFSHLLLNTPLTNDQQLALKAIYPPVIIRILMDKMIPLALLPEHPDSHSTLVRFVRWLLYVRSHYLRMPIKLLIPHLFHKTLLRWQLSK
jgi:Uncharacterised nucleotidyltransferase